MKRILTGLLAASALVSAHFAYAATLLPNGEQQFIDGNGSPYASGAVYFYIPSTMTPKTTWSNPGQTAANTNPVILDAAGRAIIYGVGTYRQILKDALGNTIWDQLTQGYGTGGFPVTNITGSTTISGCAGIFSINNLTAAPITVNIPAGPSDGDSCEFKDSGNNSAQYPITLSFGSRTTTMGFSTYVMTTNAMAIWFTWINGVTKWAPN